MVLVLVGACSKAPTAGDCSKSLDHLIELEIDNAGGNKGLTDEMKADLEKQKASVSDAQREQFMDACVKKTPKSIVDCTINAKTLEAAAKCDE